MQNAGDLSEKLVKLAENEEFRNDLANRAFNYAGKNFSVETHLENLKKLYESII